MLPGSLGLTLACLTAYVLEIRGLADSSQHYLPREVGSGTDLQNSTGISNSIHPTHPHAISKAHCIMAFSINWDPLTKALDLATTFWHREGAPLTPIALTDASLRRLLRERLRKSYRVDRIHIRYPFIFLGCSRTIPSYNARPFTIGGLLAIWTEPSNLNLLRMTPHGTPTYTSRMIITDIMRRAAGLEG